MSAYRELLAEATKELVKVAKQRAEIESRYRALMKVIEGLQELERVPHGRLQKRGFTDAIRGVLLTAGKPLTPTEIRDELVKIHVGINEDGRASKNLLINIHTTIKRMREVERVTDSHGRSAYGIVGLGSLSHSEGKN